MSPTIRYDEGPARRIVALSETPEMRDQRRRVIELLDPQPGWRVLEVGCGPGHLAAELVDIVGPDGRVYGVDVSEQMLALATQPNVELVRARRVAPAGRKPTSAAYAGATAAGRGL
jgi:arsenite methyltransferase